MRFGSTIPDTSFYKFASDTKIGSITVKAHETLIINLHGLHTNANQWQRPFEFLPDRFDPTHTLAKTPSGEKRHPYAFVPFSGGTRICFGKSLAEMGGKTLLTMMT